MKDELNRKRTLKKAHELADRAGIIARHIVTGIKNKRRQAV